MDAITSLREYGLFDAKVPRYTSYPPANRFEVDVGHRFQSKWLEDTPKDAPLSLYVHIPFCRRLCWFCACRTQGTKTLGPLDDYLNDVIREIRAVATRLPDSPKMARLHFGGGTPTLMNASQVGRLCQTIFETFRPTEDFEFSVEVDPTEAEHDTLRELVTWGMERASIGIQDFDPKVQNAIGRPQSVEVTAGISDTLRELGVTSLNYDLLYGLPHQNADRLEATLAHVIALNPDRLALYGYAHVPHVSKRQVMIDSDALPSVEDRFWLANRAAGLLTDAGYQALGIDHFARPTDSLFKAANQGRLRRNFQGYTDDPCETLLGFGASAISRFPEGYTQNAVSTAAYRGRIAEEGLAGHKGYAMDAYDDLVSDMIENLMCYFEVSPERLHSSLPDAAAFVDDLLESLISKYPKGIERSGTTLRIKPDFQCATRIMASDLDRGVVDRAGHSIAI